MEKQYSFSDIFSEGPGNVLCPIQKISVNGVVFGPGMSFGPGVSIGGVNFHQYKGLPIVVDEEEGALVIKGFRTV